MKRTLFISLFTTILFHGLAQDNCNVFKWEGDTCRYQACSYLQSAPVYFQLTKEYHDIMDTALMICPDYGMLYQYKSTAYLKTGDFISWKKLMDKAVQLNPTQHLDYRGWCRFQFFRDYQGAIDDIERLALLSSDPGYSVNGMYHLHIARGLCYKMLGDNEKAIQIIVNQLKSDGYEPGVYDYLHLGVLYLNTNHIAKAHEYFTLQEQLVELAETSYYRALAYLEVNDLSKYKGSMIKARDLYRRGQFMKDDYTHPIDKVFLADIEKHLNE